MPKAVPPEPKPKVQPPRFHRPPTTPAFAADDRRPVPDLPAPSAAAVRAPDHDQPAATTPQVGERSPELDPATVVEAEDPMVTEARRLFGPRPGSGLPVQQASGGTRCPWSGQEVARIGRSSGSIEGVVRTQLGGQPIPGAFLQLIGTGHATFADAAGRYRLTFDPALVDACRSQLVRVTAPGFRARTMVLAYGAQSANVVDLETRH